MRIFLDDVRSPQDESAFDLVIRNVEDAIELVRAGKVTFISFDHDLGEPDDTTGYAVAKEIEQLAYNDEIPPIQWTIHSANPIGRTYIQHAMMGAEKFWRRNGRLK